MSFTRVPFGSARQASQTASFESSEGRKKAAPMGAAGHARERERERDFQQYVHSASFTHEDKSVIISQPIRNTFLILVPYKRAHGTTAAVI